MPFSPDDLKSRDLPALPSGKRRGLRGMFGLFKRGNAEQKQIETALASYAEARASYAKLSDQNNELAGAYKLAIDTDMPREARQPYLQLRTRLGTALTEAERALDTVAKAVSGTARGKKENALAEAIDTARHDTQAATAQFRSGQSAIDTAERSLWQRRATARLQAARLDIGRSNEVSEPTSLPPPPRRVRPTVAAAPNPAPSTSFVDNERSAAAMKRETFGYSTQGENGAAPSKPQQRKLRDHRDSLQLYAKPQRNPVAAPRDESRSTQQDPSPKGHGRGR